MTCVLALFRNSKVFAPFNVIANTALVVAGCLLFLMQVHGYQHTAYPDDFGFSSNRHIIDHFNNDIQSGDQFDQTPVAPPKETPPQP